MITTKGKLHLKRFLSMQVGTIAGSIGFGLGAVAEDVDDTRLQFEVDRQDLRLISYDYTTDRLIFKTEIPAQYAGTIYETALYNLSVDNAGGGRLISPFDSTGFETWLTSGSPATFTTTGSRIGSDALSHTPPTSGTTTSSLGSLAVDLSSFLSSDEFTLASNYINNFVASTSIRMMTDASNYYEFVISHKAPGYRISNFTKGSAIVTGSPDWARITYIEVSTTATSSSSADIAYDGLRIDRTANDTSELILISREVLSTPYVKENGKSQEIEFVMDVNI